MTSETDAASLESGKSKFRQTIEDAVTGAFDSIISGEGKQLLQEKDIAVVTVVVVTDAQINKRD